MPRSARWLSELGGVAEAGVTKERRELVLVLLAERPKRRGDALIDFLKANRRRNVAQSPIGMVLRVRAERVAFLDDAAHDRRIFARVAPDHEERRLHAFGGEDIEDFRGVGRPRSVIERDHHFLLGERQRLDIGHGADARMFARVDHNGAADADGVRVGALGGMRAARRAPCKDAKQAEAFALHPPSPRCPASPCRRIENLMRPRANLESNGGVVHRFRARASVYHERHSGFAVATSAGACAGTM